jgi:hypothetical protein
MNDDVGYFDDSDITYGAYPCKIIGDFSDPTHVEVEWGIGIRQYARYVFPLGTWCSVHHEFLNDNKDLLFGYIIFEKGDASRALLIGVSFREGVEQKHVNTLKLGELEIILTDGNIHLKGGNVIAGSKKEPMVLGDSLAEFLNDLIDEMRGLVTSLAALKVVTPSGVGTLSPDNIADLNIRIANIVTMKGELTKFKSTKNFLE